MTDWVFKQSPRNPLSPHPMSTAPLVIGAGGDLFMPGSRGDQKDMKAALRRGTLTRAALRQSASRVAALAKELHNR